MILYGLPFWMLAIFLFLLGAVLGSFLNVCIFRIPQREEFWASLRELWNRPSACPFCRTEIRWYDNIPIFGWLFLSGRCRVCRHRIPSRYPAIELLNAVLFVVVYWFEVPTGWYESLQESVLYTPLGPEGVPGTGWLSSTAVLHWRYAYHMVLIEALLVATFIDFDLRIIPDGVTLPATAVGVAAAVAIGHLYLVPVYFQDPLLVSSILSLVSAEWSVAARTWPVVPEWIDAYPHLHGLAVSLAGLVVGGGVTWGVRLIGNWVLRQEAMGFGDVVLMAMIGSFLGWQPVVVVLFMASPLAILGIVVSGAFFREREIPFGPYLSLAAVVLLLGWQQVWPIAERVFSLGPLLVPIALFMATLLALSLMLVQLVKRLLGIGLDSEEWNEEWTSADQLHYFAGKHADGDQGRWRMHHWPGISSGRGTAHFDYWRNATFSRGPEGRATVNAIDRRPAR